MLRKNATVETSRDEVMEKLNGKEMLRINAMVEICCY